MKKLLALFALLLGVISSSTLISQESNLLNKVRDNDIDAVEALIAAGADVNMQDDMMGYTPLYLAVTANHPDMAELLISNGADINKKDKTYGYTPLMMALQSGHTSMAKWLISEGADIKIRGNNGATALIVAAMNSREMVELLLQKGADITARSENGSGVMTNCVMGIISGRVKVDLAEFLLSKGADINEVNTTEYYGGYTPLFWAVEDNNKELVGFLIQHGAEVNVQSKKGHTPLSLAEEAGYAEIVEMLKVRQ
jgi:ankyrin repeat protein